MSDSLREDALTSALVDVAIESWRFLRVVEKIVISLDADQQRRAIGRVAYFQKRVTDTLEIAGLKLVVLDGSHFDPGLAATAVNAADFDPHDSLVVEHTLEPVVMGPDGVVRTGTVTLRRVTA